MIEVPEEFIGRVGAVAREVLGSRDATGHALAHAVRRVSEVYTRRRDAIDDEAGVGSALAARLRFFLPRDMPKVAGPLEELRRAGALPGRRTWRVLDLGAGVGTTTFGTARFARERDAADALEVVAIDRDPTALEAMRAIAADAHRAGLVPIELTTHAADLRDAASLAPGPFDLILLGLVLNEGRGAGTWSQRALLNEGLLAEDGAIVVIEPALRGTSRKLHALRDAIVAQGGPLRVFAPCLRGEGCPMLESERDWCHEDMHVALPPASAEIARAAGLRWERLTYSYLTLRRDGRTLRDTLDPDAGEPYRVVSQPLPSKGKLEIFGCGAPGRVRLARLDRHRGPENSALDGADRGAILTISGASPSERGRLRVGPGATVGRSGSGTG